MVAHEDTTAPWKSFSSHGDGNAHCSYPTSVWTFPHGRLGDAPQVSLKMNGHDLLLRNSSWPSSLRVFSLCIGEAELVPVLSPKWRATVPQRCCYCYRQALLSFVHNSCKFEINKSLSHLYSSFIISIYIMHHLPTEQTHFSNSSKTQALAWSKEKNLVIKELV